MTPIRQLLLGNVSRLGLMMTYPAPGIVERIGADWDWIWIDGQHGQFGYSELLAMVRAADLVQRPSLVRVPSLDAGTIGQVLDIGADGVIIPCINMVAQAEVAVQAAKFAPMGERSYGGRRLADRCCGLGRHWRCQHHARGTFQRRRNGFDGREGPVRGVLAASASMGPPAH